MRLCKTFFPLAVFLSTLNPTVSAIAQGSKSVGSAGSSYSMQCTSSWLDCNVVFENGLMIVEVLKPPAGDRRLGAYNVTAANAVANSSQGAVIPISVSNINKFSSRICTYGDDYSPLAGKVGDCSTVSAIFNINMASQSMIAASKYNPRETRKWDGNWILTLYLPNNSSSGKFAKDFEQFFELGKKSLIETQNSSPGY
jgi:hypothetical protein